MKAILANGCFWCTEAVFKRLKGVKSVIPGYAGGTTKNPTYEEVSTGSTGHAEAIQFEFDPKIISYQKLLEVFFKTHDPTTLNRQGGDVGTQYRSVIFYSSDKQKHTTKTLIDKLDQSGEFKDPIVTEISLLDKFYPAEDYHHDYYTKNKNQPYCRINIDPKIKKLYQHFPKETI